MLSRRHLIWNKKSGSKAFYKGLDQIYTKLLSKDEFSVTMMKLRLGFLVTNFLGVLEYIWWTSQSDFLFVDKK